MRSQERWDLLSPGAAAERDSALLPGPAELLELPAPAGESYRSYLRAAVLVCLVAGAALGTLNLTWLVSWATSGVTLFTLDILRLLRR